VASVVHVPRGLATRTDVLELGRARLVIALTGRRVGVDADGVDHSVNTDAPGRLTDRLDGVLGGEVDGSTCWRRA
jgi:hypothetical protein